MVKFVKSKHLSYKLFQIAEYINFAIWDREVLVEVLFYSEVI